MNRYRAEGYRAEKWWQACAGIGRALFKYERRGVDLATGQWVGNPKAVVKRTRVIAAAPAAAFRCQVIPLAAPMTRAQQMTLLEAKGLVLEEQALDFLTAPEQLALAVFTLPKTQREAWCRQAAGHGYAVVALEPDVHALWRYASEQRLTHQAWLAVHERKATLYWPTSWPWGYHAEPVVFDCAAAIGYADAFMTALRRARLMTGRDSPQRHAILFAGQHDTWALWQSIGEYGITWERGRVPSPVAAGAALKPQKRWV